MDAKEFLISRGYCPSAISCNDNSQAMISRHMDIITLMEQYAFEAWKCGEDNGRTRLSPYGELDLKGSKDDFKRWLSKKFEEEEID